jgi:nucleotide-binding universal stress UspA family protein
MKVKSSNKKEHLLHDGQAGQNPSSQASLSASHPSPGLKSILVPIDFSECGFKALEYATVLAQKFHAKLILLHVVEPAVFPQNYLVNSSTVDEANRNLIAETSERLAQEKQRLCARGLVIEILVRIGHAQSDISDTANATAVDLIVMGAHGNSGLKQLLLGGTAERVLRHSRCPVLTVP